MRKTVARVTSTSVGYKNTNVLSSAGAEKRWSVDTWKIKRCWTDDEVIWRTQVIPTVPRTLKGPDAPTESERTAHEITHLPPTPKWSTTCVLGRGMETPHVRHTTSERDERPFIAIEIRSEKAPSRGGEESMTIWVHSWKLSIQVPAARVQYRLKHMEPQTALQAPWQISWNICCLLRGLDYVAATKPQSWRWKRK